MSYSGSLLSTSWIKCYHNSHTGISPVVYLPLCIISANKNNSLSPPPSFQSFLHFITISSHFQWLGSVIKFPLAIRHFLIRIKLPSGRLTASKGRAIARIAVEYGKGELQITICLKNMETDLCVLQIHTSCWSWTYRRKASPHSRRRRSFRHTLWDRVHSADTSHPAQETPIAALPRSRQSIHLTGSHQSLTDVSRIFVCPSVSIWPDALIHALIPRSRI